MNEEKRVQLVSRKRKLSDDSLTTETQRAKLDRKYDECALLNLSDEILLEIAIHLDHITLLCLGSTCTRLQNFILDKNLWIFVDFSKKPTTKKDIKNYIKYLTPHTKSLKIRGTLSLYPHDAWKNVISKDILDEITLRAPDLDNLEILESTFQINEMRITCFPPKLKCLQIINSESLHPRDSRNGSYGFFAKMETHLVDLEKLSLETCSWFEVHDFIVFSKLPKLKHLNLKGCQNLRDGVPYCSISTRFGFKSLEILDVRDTPISDSDIQCFNITNTLRELYMECPTHLRNHTDSTGESPSLELQNLNRIRNRILHQAGEDNVIVYVLGSRGLQQAHIGNVQENNQNMIHGEQGEENPQPAVAVLPRRPGDVVIYRNTLNNNELRHINSFLDNRNANPPPLSLISDRAMLSFGLTRNNPAIAMVWIRAQPRPPNTFLEVLHVRNYKLVTDITLRHLAHCSPNLKILDVTGTSVTLNGITDFKQAKPDCQLISHILNDD